MHTGSGAGLQFDLRLERDGVLKSWSIPKGMPTDKRHLAIEIIRCHGWTLKVRLRKAMVQEM